MALQEKIDRIGLACSILLLALLLLGILYAPDFVISIHGPASYVFPILLVVVLLVHPFQPLRESWLWHILLGAMVLAWGLHNISGPSVALVMGYGFALLGALSVMYGVYSRFAPPTWPNPPTIEHG